MQRSVEWIGPDGSARAGRLEVGRESSAACAGVLLVGWGAATEGFVRTLSERLTQAGSCVLALDGEQMLAPRSDREAVAELETALAALAQQPEVDADELALIGLARAGTLAYLCACASRRVSAIVDVCGRLEYPQLDARQPVQPLDMALNLTAPILLLYAEQDSDPNSAAMQQATARLQRALRDVQAVALPGRAADFLDEGASSYHARHVACAAEAIESFLRATRDPS